MVFMSKCEEEQKVLNIISLYATGIPIINEEIKELLAWNIFSFENLIDE